MAPPITQPTTTNSTSTSNGSTIPTNRLEREAKKHDRRYVFSHCLLIQFIYFLDLILSVVFVIQMFYLIFHLIQNFFDILSVKTGIS